MGSVINYRFSSLKNFSKIFFEGVGLQGWELKSEIISQKQMLSDDFDLQLYESETNTEINDEQVVYRNSSVIVKRVPIWMARSRPLRERQSIKQKKNHKIPPPNYVCFRCGQKGHYIQFCPTNHDKTYDIVRIRKPTGIPKAFLVPTSSDQIPEAASKLVTTEGLVQVQPQTHEWKKMIRSTPNLPKKYQCSICNLEYAESTKFDCGHIFCVNCAYSNSKCKVCTKDSENKKE